MTDALHRHKVFRRLSLLFTLYLTWVVYDFSMISIATGAIDQEWMIAALLTPISALQAAVFKFYAESGQ